MTSGAPRPPAVLHIDTERTWRGGENQIRMLVTHPSAAAWEWHLAAPPDSEVMRRLPPAVHRLPLKMRGARMLFAARSIAAYIRRHGITVLACQSSRAHSLALLVGMFAPNVQIVVHRRVDYPPTNSWWSRRKYLSPRVTRYLCVSDAVARVLREYGVPDRRVTTIHDAVDPALHAGTDRAAARARLYGEWGIAPGTPVIGNVAFLTHQKGHDTLVRALGALSAAHVPFFCYVAGSGPLESSLRQLAASLGLGDGHLRFLGIRSDVSELLAAADVFALSSNDEGLGSSLLDAAYAGCALVATRVGGIPEIVVDEQTGLLAPARDHEAFARQLRRVIEDPELRAKLAAGARAHVNELFSWAAMVDQTLDVYRGAKSDT